MPLTEPLDALIDRLQGDWRPIVQAWRASEAGRTTVAHVDQRVAAGAVVYPAQVFRALELTPLAHTRVVILGQDPYHGSGQAEGLAFSVPIGVPLPPSLRNVYKELRRDVGGAVPSHGHLGAWAERGVLLLNSSLTVEDGAPGSHAKLGWQALTNSIIGAVSAHPVPKVFMLWGAHAQAKAALITGASTLHEVLCCNHPSPLSALRPPAPFVGCGHFGAAQRFLDRHAEQAPALGCGARLFDLC